MPLHSRVEIFVPLATFEHGEVPHIHQLHCFEKNGSPTCAAALQVKEYFLKTKFIAIRCHCSIPRSVTQDLVYGHKDWSGVFPF